MSFARIKISLRSLRSYSIFLLPSSQLLPGTFVQSWWYRGSASCGDDNTTSGGHRVGIAGRGTVAAAGVAGRGSVAAGVAGRGSVAAAGVDSGGAASAATEREAGAAVPGGAFFGIEGTGSADEGRGGFVIGDEGSGDGGCFGGGVGEGIGGGGCFGGGVGEGKGGGGFFGGGGGEGRGGGDAWKCVVYGDGSACACAWCTETGMSKPFSTLSHGFLVVWLIKVSAAFSGGGVGVPWSPGGRTHGTPAHGGAGMSPLPDAYPRRAWDASVSAADSASGVVAAVCVATDEGPRVRAVAAVDLAA